MLEPVVFGVVVGAVCVVAGAVHGFWRRRTGRFRPEECVVWNAIEHGNPLSVEGDVEVIRDLLTRHHRSTTRSIHVDTVVLGLWTVGSLPDFLGGDVTDPGWAIVFAVVMAASLWSDVRRLARIRRLQAQLDVSRTHC